MLVKDLDTKGADKTLYLHHVKYFVRTLQTSFTNN